MTRIRVVLADDHALVRQGFRRILEDEMDIEVIGEAGGGAEAIDLDQRLEPDVVVLDMNMPEINGLHAAIEILRRRPDRPILMLSMYDDVQYVRNALNAGIKGYILKNALETDLIRAVRAVAAGKRFLSPELAAAMRKMTTFGEPKTPEQAQRMLNLLTPSERRAYMAAVGQEAEAPEASNRQLRRRMEYGGAGMPGRTKPASDRPGSAGRKTGKGAKKKR